MLDIVRVEDSLYCPRLSDPLMTVGRSLGKKPSREYNHVSREAGWELVHFLTSRYLARPALCGLFCRPNQKFFHLEAELCGYIILWSWMTLERYEENHLIILSSFTIFFLFFDDKVLSVPSK